MIMHREVDCATTAGSGPWSAARPAQNGTAADGRDQTRYQGEVQFQHAREYCQRWKHRLTLWQSWHENRRYLTGQHPEKQDRQLQQAGKQHVTAHVERMSRLPMARCTMNWLVQQK